MSKLGLVLVMVLMLGRTNAQTYPSPNNEPLTYFVLIQADDGQPFYIRLDNQLYSSSPAGHLILARLKDSVYAITIGSPGQTYPEQRYLLNIHQKDWALRITRQDNRWGLFDSQGEGVATVADPATTEKPLLAGMKKDDAFSQLMSAIVQDTAVMYNTYATAPDSTQSVALAPASSTHITHDTSALVTPSITHDTSALATSMPTPPAPTDTGSSRPASASSSTADAAIPSAPTGVVKLSEHRSIRSLSLVYADHPADQRTDTIDVDIPIDSQTAAASHPQSVDTPRSTPGHTPRSDSPNLAAISHRSSLPFVNSDCRAFATDYDVDKLRVRMLNAMDEDRIETAYKVFKTKCFTTKQIRALSEVFTTDAARFKFLVTAYPFVSDDAFPELVNLLSDPIYSGRFRNMTDRH